MPFDNDDEYTVRKYATYIPVSDELIDDMLCYSIAADMERRMNPTRLDRFRWWASRIVTNVRLGIARKIAGKDMLCDHDYYDE